jgi:hypothetical protein
VHESLIGTKRTRIDVRFSVAAGGQTDVGLIDQTMPVYEHAQRFGSD